MGCYQHIWCQPQWMVGWKGLGVGDVEGRTNASIGEFSKEGISVDDRAPRNVDDQGTMRESREERAVHQVMSFWAIGDRKDDHVSCRQQVVQFIEAMDAVARRPRNDL